MSVYSPFIANVSRVPHPMSSPVAWTRSLLQCYPWGGAAPGEPHLPASAARAADRLAAAHSRLVADGRIQFTLPGPEQPPGEPQWAKWLGRNLKPAFQWLGDQGPAFRVLFWAIVAALTFVLLRALWRRFGHLLGRKPDTERGPDPVWRPERAAARALLADADRLAAEGRFEEAAHLLLLRSVDQIAARRPGTVRPALTSRELASAPVLPSDVRTAFAAIARAVEASWFGAAPLAADAWARCRTAYEEVALPRAWAPA